MDKNALKKALINGIPPAILIWLMYTLLSMRVEKKTFGEAMFSIYPIILVIVLMVGETVTWYRKLRKKK